MSYTNRRDFAKQCMLGVASIPLFGFADNLLSKVDNNKQLLVHIFSKHLQFLDYKSTGAIANELGFDGVDLTVRANGHVLPESVTIDLPKACSDIKQAGSKCTMITTSIESTDNPFDVDVLNTASKQGITYYRTNWFKYKKDESFESTLSYYQKEIKKLGNLNAKLGLVGCYQNHAGLSIGASFWELKSLLETVNTDSFGIQYDIRHAMVESGYSWKNGLQLLKSHIKTIALKDFKWHRIKGKWQVINVPIGEGMIDFQSFFKLLKHYKLSPKASLHLEYDLGGAEKGKKELSVDKQVVFNAMKRDLNAVQKLWQLA